MNSEIQIFVGGSGRSGTSFVARRLGQTKEIARVPYETRFLTDNKGAIDLFDSLTENFSIDKARSSVEDFKELMLELDSPFTAPYIGYRMSRLSGKKSKYSESLEKLLGEITSGQFYAWDKQNRDRMSLLMVLSRIVLRTLAFSTKSVSNRFQYKKIRTKSHLFLPKYYRDKSELAQVIARYADGIFYSYAEQEGKSGWCENTPSSILHYEKLRLIFPEAYFINVVRNPVAVACSLLKRVWAPNDENSIVNYIGPLYQRLIDIDSVASNNPSKYKMIKFESLEEENGMEPLYDFIGIHSTKDQIERFEVYEANAWKSSYKQATINYFEERLEEPLRYFNYL